MVNKKTFKKYKAYLNDELEAASIYNILAKSYINPDKASIFIKLAESEIRHASHWAKLIGLESSKLNYNKNTIRTIYVKLVCRLFGPDKILPWLARIESAGVRVYDNDPEAKFLSSEERNHAKTILQMASTISPKSHQSNESTIKSVAQGNVRAAILGINDGLISNFCLIMGFAGGATATGNPEYILLAGFAGLLAGSLSMGAGEYVSVKAQVDLYEYQISKETEELILWPEEELEELKLIYMAKGLSEDLATETAQSIIDNPESAINTMVREELGLNPDDLGSPITASITSILSFTMGAIVPIIPFMLTSGNLALILTSLLSIFSLMIIGGITALNTGVNLLKGSMRMLFFGSAAALITYISGTLIGVGLS